jgi:hypothetical protein
LVPVTPSEIFRKISQNFSPAGVTSPFVVSGLLLHGHRKIVPAGARADAQIFTNIGNVPFAHFHAARVASDAGAHLVESFGVLGSSQNLF